jgi:redox-sensitive bicupin YhaK (pirin superfamily)
MATPLLLGGRVHDLGGGLVIRRLLPSAKKQGVGPFLFFDHFGPAAFAADAEFDVLPHPHIGLATVTYLYEGALMHRDSLGSVQRIEPGAVNWMSAGRGIVHSERRPDDLKGRAFRSHGLQLWAALPRGREEDEPFFEHTPAPAIPEERFGGVTARLLVGRAFGLASPVRAASETLYLDLAIPAGGSFTLEPIAPERAVYVTEGGVAIDGTALAPHTLAVLEPGRRARLDAARGARVAVIGGEPLDGRRLIWWNFVSTRRECILRAADDWAADRFAKVPGEAGRIPLPDKRP